MISTANGLRVLRCSLHVPRTGVWHADVSVDAEDAADLEGAVELVLAGATWKGTSRRAGPDVGRVELRVVGGAGGLSTELEPRYYADAPASVPLSDLMRESGETLSQSVSADVMNPVLARWTRSRGRAGRAIADLVQTLELDAWRLLADGTVWLGAESWPEVELEHDVISVDPVNDCAVLAVDELSLTPGTVVGGRGISRLMHLVQPDGRVRSIVWYEAPGVAGAPAPVDGTSISTPGTPGNIIS